MEFHSWNLPGVSSSSPPSSSSCSDETRDRFLRRSADSLRYVLCRYFSKQDKKACASQARFVWVFRILLLPHVWLAFADTSNTQMRAVDACFHFFGGNPPTPQIFQFVCHGGAQTPPARAASLRAMGGGKRGAAGAWTFSRLAPPPLQTKSRQERWPASRQTKLHQGSVCGSFSSALPLRLRPGRPRTRAAADGVFPPGSRPTAPVKTPSSLQPVHAPARSRRPLQLFPTH